MPPHHHLPSLPLGALRAFDAAARHGSFKAAALELSVTPGAVSQQIKLLELRLRVRLFERLHRSLRLTRAGTELAGATATAFGLLNETVIGLVTQGLGGSPTTLTITSAPSFASRWLGGRLADFEALHPTLELRLLSENALADIAHDPGHDIALRYGSGPYEASLHAEPLWPSDDIIAVCAPGLLAEDMRRLLTANPGRRLRVALPPTPAGVEKPGWSAWLRRAGLDEPHPARAAERGPMFSNTQLALEAAASGRGVALSPRRLVQDDLDAGRLVQASEVVLPDPYRFWLIHARDRSDESRIRAFVKWIRSAAASSP